MNVLFVTWDGPQTAYLEGLFLPIFKRLQAGSYRFHVLQFTWGESGRRAAQACAAADLSYRRVEVWRRCAGTGPFLSAAFGARHVRRAIRDFSINVVMPRSNMPALAVMFAGGGRRFPMLLDADGLPADERVDFAGLSPRSVHYLLLRRIETASVRRSEAVLVRTERAKAILAERTGAKSAKFHVVANGRDTTLFAPLRSEERLTVRAELGVDEAAPLLVYAGSLGSQYCFRQMLELAASVQRMQPAVRLLLLTGSPDVAEQEIETFDRDAGEWCIVRKVPPKDVPRFVGAADVGLALRQPAFSMQAVAPIKVGEYLLCGLPVVGTRGIGDTDPLIERGVFFPAAVDQTSSLEEASRWIVEVALARRPELATAARQCGLDAFSLDASVRDYRHALASLQPTVRRAGA